ncbi:MAG: hypothetical protein FWG40_00505 [Peptococcaceae bacterium]|nr:hypothetical protein [Peptococcaceae bacterium]
MKKVIEGKMYDTDTAKAVAFWDNNLGRTDFGWYSETLYKKKTGEFFLHGEGNANSKYTTPHGENSWGGGEETTPLSISEAQKWAERLDGDEYVKIFGDVEE